MCGALGDVGYVPRTDIVTHVFDPHIDFAKAGRKIDRLGQ